MVRIIHHNDLDGYASGYLVGKYFKELGKTDEDIEYIVCNYESEVDTSKFTGDDEIYIVDYHLPAEKIESLSKVFKEVVWIDHHVSAIEEYKEYFKNKGKILEEEILGSWRNGDAATLLVYEWFYGTDNIPTWVRLVDAWDTWKEDSPYYANAELLNLAVQNILSIDLIKELDTSKDFYLKCIETGAYYKEYRDQWSEYFSKKYGFETEIELEDGTIANAYVLTIGNANSKFFGNKINDYDFCITQGFDGEKWNVSVYSNKKNMDCSKLAQHFGGGGHKGAAGFTYNEIKPLFTKIKK